MKKHRLFPIRMAKNLFLGAFMLLALAATAQNGEVVTDTTEVIVGNKVITITIDTLTGKKDVQVKTRVASHDIEDPGYYGQDDDDNDKDSARIKPVDAGFFKMDLGANWLLSNNSFSLPPSESNFETEPLRSTEVALHFLPTHFNMFKGHVGLVTAITFDNIRYQFRNDVTFVPNQPQVTLVQDSVSFKKNKLNMWYGQIPLLLCFQTNPSNHKKNFHISLGGFAGLFLGANTKQKSDAYGKVIRKDDYNLEPLRYGLTARIGFGNLELYSNYTLSNVFRDGQGPTFNNINFGIALTGMM
jgi:hypothetical protein